MTDFISEQEHKMHHGKHAYVTVLDVYFWGVCDGWFVTQTLDNSDCTSVHEATISKMIT